MESVRDFVGPHIQPAPMMSDEELMEPVRDFTGRDVQTQVIFDAVVDAVDGKMQVIIDAVVDAIDIKIQAGAYVLYTKIGDEFDAVHRRLTHVNAEVHGLYDEVDLVQLLGTTALVVLCFVLVCVMNVEALTMLMVFKDGQPLSLEEQRHGEYVATDRVVMNRSDMEVIGDSCIYVVQVVGAYLFMDLLKE